MATEVLMPALSPTMTEGTLARWLKKEGDIVNSGDVLAEIETDKATMEVEAIDEGTLGKILVAEGTGNVAVNTPIALLLGDGEQPGAEPTPTPTPITAAPAAPTQAAPPAANAAPAAPRPAPQAQPGTRLFVSPLARRIAADANIDLSTITGTGPNGRIVRADVEFAAASPKPAAQPQPAAAPTPQSAKPARAPTPPKPAPAPVTITDPHRAVPNSSMRRAIAKRLAASANENPHFYVTVDIELDALLAMRTRLNAKSPAGDAGFKISVNDMLIKAVAVAHRRVPGVAVTFTEDAVLHYDNIDIAVAVAIPDGLITPIIRDADRKGLAVIHREAADLFRRARDGKLKPEEYQGGGFSISNLGMFGVREFTALINPPQAAILAVGAGQPRAVVRAGELAVATVMSCTMSADHRAIDGALSAKYLHALKTILEDPLELML